MKVSKEKQTNKKFTSFIAMLLVWSMIFTQQAFVTFADGMGAETFTTKASSEQSQDVEQNEGTTIEQWSSEAKPIEKSVDDADENKEQSKEHIALTDGSKDGAEDNASSDGFNEPYDNNNKGSKNDNEEEPEADPTKVGGGRILAAPMMMP